MLDRLEGFGYQAVVEIGGRYVGVYSRCWTGTRLFCIQGPLFESEAELEMESSIASETWTGPRRVTAISVHHDPSPSPGLHSELMAPLEAREQRFNSGRQPAGQQEVSSSGTSPGRQALGCRIGHGYLGFPDRSILESPSSSTDVISRKSLRRIFGQVGVMGR